MNKLNEAKRIEIKTPFGLMFAEPSTDPNYPGIYICIEQEDNIGDKYERQLALIECTPDMPASGMNTLRLLAWCKKEIEDYTDNLVFDGFESHPVNSA